MNWNEIKQAIIQDLESRGLSDPSIRINALSRVEGIMKLHYTEIISDPAKLLSIDKKEFKLQLAKHKPNEKLNGAEDSIVNEIYYRI